MLRPMTSRVLSERRGDAVLVTLNAPERRNAIDQEMVDGLHAVLDELEHDDSVAALVVTGAGDKAFAAGADIAQLRDRTSADAMKAINSAIFNRVEEFPAPVIAAVKGYALGGGCELAIACDLRVLGASAKMGQPEVKLGIIPAAGGTYRLPRLIGPALAKELIFTGRRVKADEAQRLGLINRTAGPGEGALLEVCRELASPILRAAPIALKQAKRAVNAGLEVALPTAMLIEQACYDVTIPTEDRLEALAAFREKRSPNFKGR